MTTPHHPASLWGCPFGSLAKAKVGEKNSWLMLMLAMGKHDQKGYRTTFKGLDGLLEFSQLYHLLMHLSTPDRPIMTACFNYNNTVWEIHRNIRDHTEESTSQKTCSVKHDPKIGKGEHRRHLKGNKESLQEYLVKTRAKGMVVTKYR